MLFPPSTIPQQTQFMQATAEIIRPPTSVKRPASSISSVFSSFGFKPHHHHPTICITPRISKCTHLAVTRSHIPGSLPTPSYPRDLFLVRMETDKCCQRCHKPHYFRWVYVCNNCGARACHNCRPKWADRAWVSFGGLLGVESQKDEGAMVGKSWGQRRGWRQLGVGIIGRPKKVGEWRLAVGFEGSDLASK